MATMPPGTRPTIVAQDDIYMTLLITSAVVLLIGVVYIAVRSYQLLGSVWPVSGA
jgi:hypothetical protein